MTKRRPLITLIVYIVLGLITESIIFYLFPFTGLGGIVCYPFCVILSLAFGWTLYKLTQRRVAKIVLVVISLCFLTVQFYLELKIHPQDFGGSPFLQISTCKKALNEFDNIRYNDFGNLTKMEKLVYKFKFKEKLPSCISTLTIDRPEDTSHYTINNYADGKITCDTNKINFSFTDTSVVIYEKLKNERLRVSVVPMKTLLSQKGGGYYDQMNSVFYNVYEDNFQFKTGLEQVFYYYLMLTKQASRQHAALRYGGLTSKTYQFVRKCF